MLRSMRFLPGRRWGRVSLVLGGATALAAGIWFGRGMFIHQATAQQTAQSVPSEAEQPGSEAVTAREGFQHGLSRGGGAIFSQVSQIFLRNN